MKTRVWYRILVQTEWVEKVEVLYKGFVENLMKFGMSVRTVRVRPSFALNGDRPKSDSGEELFIERPF